LRPRAFIAAVLIVFMVCLAMLPAGCGGGGEEITQAELQDLALQDSFALYYPVSASITPSVPAYTVSMDLSDVVGMDAASLPAGVARTLAAQGFVTVAGGGESMFDAYLDIAGPKFVTIDVVMHALDRLRIYALGDIERGSLVEDLGGLISALYDTTLRMRDGCEGKVRDAALSNLAYLGVAARLLGIEVAVTPEVEASVNGEIALIEAASGEAPSPLSGYVHDYSRYRPRGHYLGQGDLEGYYRAMTWLGGTGFYPRPGALSGDIEAGRHMTRQALLLVSALHVSEVDGEPAYGVWDRIYQPTSFLASCADDLNACIYTRLARELMGDSFPLSSLGDDALLDEFIQRALEEQTPLILSAAGEGLRSGESDVAFRLFGRSGYPDDYIFGQLVAPEVTERFMPRGLDVPAALGSERALEILEQFYGEKIFEGYEDKMNYLRGLLRNIDPKQVHSNLYLSRLDVLRLVLKPCGDGYPAFMRSSAWQDRGLYAFLGSWAELRHEDKAYAAQGGERQSEAQAVSPGGYVEPNPEACARLAAATDMIRRGLEGRGLASEPLRERLQGLYDLLISLKTMAEKELRGESLSAEEYAAIAGTGDTLRNLAAIPADGGAEPGLGIEASLPLVDTVYEDSNFGEVLQVAVGKPVTCYVIAPVGGVPTLTVGAGFSYFEFVKSADSHVTDEAWRETAGSENLPERPAWSSSFLQ
jgi:hypothetical protein